MAGSVHKRLTGKGQTRWQAKMRLGRDEAGAWGWRTGTYDTQREAKAALRAWEREIEEPAQPGADRPLADYLRTWLRTVKRHTVRPTTYQSYTWQVEAHIVPQLGHVLLGNLTTGQIQAYYSAQRDAGGHAGGQLSPRMVRYSHGLLKQALDHAVRSGILRSNPAAAAVPPRAAPKAGERWSNDQAARFLVAAAGAPYSPIWPVALATGLRLGELLGLRWSDVDLDGGTLGVARSVAPLRGIGATMQDPKSRRGVRAMAIGPRLVALLGAHRAAQLQARMAARTWEDGDLVFASRAGTPITAGNLRRAYLAAIVAAGVPRIRLHDLRHTNASALVEAGVGIDTVSRRLGHADSRITQHLYVHAGPEADAAAAGAIEDRLFGTGG